MIAKNGKETVQSVQRCLDVLEAVAGAGRPMGVSELARHLSMSKATVYRLCQTLVVRQFLQQDLRSGQYSPGWRLIEVTCLLAGQLDLKRISRPILEQMAADGSQNAFAGAVLDCGEMLIYDEVRVDNPVQPRSLLGLRLPLSKAPGGLLCQATSPNAVAAIDPQVCTPAELGQQTLQPYTVQVNVPYTDIVVICSPVLDRMGTVTGILGFCHPAMKQMPANEAHLGDKCVQAAHRLSDMQASLSYKGLGVPTA